MASYSRSLVARFREGVKGVFSKSVTQVASSVNGFLHGAGVGLPHEPFAGAWQKNIDSASSSGLNILAFGSVYACINVISSDIARLPAIITRPRAGGGREVHNAHPGMAVLRRPNAFQTPLQFFQGYFSSKLIWGNTYVFLLRDARGVINEMYVLDPRKVLPLITSEGGVYYRIGQDNLIGTSNELVVPARDILHDRAVCLFHPLVGVSPLFAASVSAALGARIIVNSERFFSNLSRASGVLTAPGKLEPAVAKRLQNEWENNFSARGLGKVAILSNGLKFEPMTMPAVDAQLIEQLRWTEQNVAAVYRVPNFKLGDLNKTTYRNSEAMARDYHQNCLSYHIEGSEQLFERHFELPWDQHVEYDLRPLFRMETETRYSAYKTALNAGFISINEVRDEEGLAPVKGGEEPRVQAQYLPLSKADGTGVNVPGAAPAPAPDTEEEPDDEDEDEIDDAAVENAAMLVSHVFKDALLGDDNGA